MAALLSISTAATMAVAGGVIGYYSYPMVADGSLSWTDPLNLADRGNREFAALQVGAMWALVGYAFGLALE